MTKKEKIPKGIRARYSCTICGEGYGSLEDAVECYSRGKLKRMLPKGTLISSSGHKDMVFVISKYTQFRHGGSYSMSAFRDTPVGDNKEPMCGDDFYKVSHLLSMQPEPYYTHADLVSGAKYNAVNTKTPAFDRAVEFAKSKYKNIHYWNGSKLIKI